MTLDIILAGFSDALTLTNMFYVVVGVLVGQIVGAIPGIGPVMTMAIVIPFTFALSPLSAISCLIGINKGGLVGGAIPSILINTPGTPDAAATALDGHPIAKQGKPLKATKMALFSSVTGDTVSDLVLITVSAPLAVLAFKMGPVEIFALIVFSFCVISGLMGDSVMKAIISLMLGILFATVGLEPENSTPRLIFGHYELYDGFPIVAVAIGMLAMSEILHRLATIVNTDTPAVTFDKNQPKADRNVSFKEYWACRFVLLRGASIGVFLGAVPGIGSTAAAFMSYAFTKKASKNPESYGKGNIKGVAATESANSSVLGASLIPLLTLGIPGSINAALLIGAFMIHGLTPGPTLFEKQAELVYAIFGAMIFANITNLSLGLICMRLWSRVVRAPETIVFSVSFILCIIGVYLSTGTIFGVGLMFFFAIIGILMNTLGYSGVIFILAFFLQPRLEESFVQSMTLLDGNMLNITSHPVALTFLILGGMILLIFMRSLKRNTP